MNRETKARITVLPTEATIITYSSSNLLQALRRAGIEIAAPCNGQGLCGKCKVRISHAVPQTGSSHKFLSKEEITADIRLACETEVQDGMVVTLLMDHCLDVRVLENQRIQCNQIAPVISVKGIDGKFRLFYQDHQPVELLDWQEGFSPKGLAVDIGTTTVVMTLMELLTGKELATASALNPQVRFGHDVVTRIQHSSTPEGLEELSSAITCELNELTEKVCHASGTTTQEILDVVVGGNPTMLFLAAAIDPTALGRMPFTVNLDSGCTYSKEKFGLNINRCARVYIPPIAHAFVGSDISAGLLDIGFFSRKKPMLFMDLGTNGEIALIAKGRIFITSTAVGPAFEGMGITHGMRAAPGAIETIWTDGNFLNLRTIDDAPALGICGSGIIDLVASMLQLDILEANGRLKDPTLDGAAKGPFADRYVVIGNTPAIQLINQLFFSQKDIRQFQLAKSAVQTGAEMLLDAASIGASDLEKIVISGGFGYHIRKESLRVIGLLPRGFQGLIDFAGNTSRTGCATLLTDAKSRCYLEEQMRQIMYLQIGEKAEFHQRFVKNMALS